VHQVDRREIRRLAEVNRLIIFVTEDFDVSQGDSLNNRAVERRKRQELEEGSESIRGTMAGWMSLLLVAIATIIAAGQSRVIPAEPSER